MTTSRATALLACSLGAACARQARQPEPRRVSLLPLFEFTEVRADGADLPFLLSLPLLEHRGWAREAGSRGGPVLWMQGTSASLRIPLASAADRELVVRARANAAVRRRLPLLLSWNDRPAGRVLLEAGEQEFRLRLPAGMQVEGENELRFEAAARAVAHRTLAVSSLSVSSAHGDSAAAIPERSGPGLSLPAGAGVSFDLAQAARSVSIRVRAGRAARSRVRADVHADGRHWPLLDLELSGGEVRQVLEPLPAAAGGIYRLDLASQGGGVLVEELDLLGEPSPPPAPLPERPNVVLFLVDALRADVLGAYGHRAPTSPRFDAFSREAVVFEHASAQSSWTRPSVASLLTGLGAEAHGVGGLTNVLVPQITTLAEALRAAGYRTGALVANPVVSRALGFDQGFDSWNGVRAAHRRADAMVAPALAWIERAGQPFFLYLHTLDPHKPYEPEPEHRKPFLFDGYHGSRDLSVLLSKPQRSPDELRFLRGAYQGEVHQNDAAFGAFLDGLAARGLLERTLIVYTADHGEELFDHGSYGHGGSLYGEVLHIPLALRLPGAARLARRDSLPVQHADVAPTVLALAGAAAPNEMTGRDLSARCRGRADAAQEPSLIVSRLTYSPADKLAARHGSLKLIVNQEPARSGRPRYELYDLARDPGETRNLAGERPLELRALRAQAAALVSAEQALRRRLGAGREVPISAEQEQQLRALGYIQ